MQIVWLNPKKDAMMWTREWKNKLMVVCGFAGTLNAQPINQKPLIRVINGQIS